MEEKFNTSPGKKTFSIGEVAEMLGIKAHTIRFWEKTFKILVPRKESGRRIFTLSDISKLKKIQKMRYQEKLQISGTKKRLQEEGITVNEYNPAPIITQKPLVNNNDNTKLQKNDIHNTPTNNQTNNNEQKNILNELNEIINILKP